MDLAVHFRDGRDGDVIASMSPKDTAAALRLLKVLVECRQMDPRDAEEWRRRIEGWTLHHALDAEARPGA